MNALLKVAHMRAGYGRGDVLHDVNLEVAQGEIVVILGANGAGKTTTMRAVAGLIRPRGEVLFGEQSLAGLKPDEIVRKGISLVPEGRGTFASLSVAENLALGAASRRDLQSINDDIERWYTAFPRLYERRKQIAGTLSGGEQQMLAVARGLMSRPKLLLCDEPSQGLAPGVVRDLFAVLADVHRSTGTAILLVEQNAELALGIARRAYVLESGVTVLSGTADELRSSDVIQRSYLGY